MARFSFKKNDPLYCTKVVLHRVEQGLSVDRQLFDRCQAEIARFDEVSEVKKIKICDHCHKEATCTFMKKVGTDKFVMCNGKDKNCPGYHVDEDSCEWRDSCIDYENRTCGGEVKCRRGPRWWGN